VRAADEVGHAVAVDVDEGRRLAAHLLEDVVALPDRIARERRPRVARPPRALAGEADEEDVEPAVLVEVVGEGEEVVGVLVRVERVDFGERVALGEVGPGVPVGTRDDVGVTVLVESPNDAPSQRKASLS
jgi:hypothetical protein